MDEYVDGLWNDEDDGLMGMDGVCCGCWWWMDGWMVGG